MKLIFKFSPPHTCSTFPSPYMNKHLLNCVVIATILGIGVQVRNAQFKKQNNSFDGIINKQLRILFDPH